MGSKLHVRRRVERSDVSKLEQADGSAYTGPSNQSLISLISNKSIVLPLTLNNPNAMVALSKFRVQYPSLRWQLTLTGRTVGISRSYNGTPFHPGSGDLPPPYDSDKLL